MPAAFGRTRTIGLADCERFSLGVNLSFTTVFFFLCCYDDFTLPRTLFHRATRHPLKCSPPPQSSFPHRDSRQILDYLAGSHSARRPRFVPLKSSGPSTLTLKRFLRANRPVFRFPFFLFPFSFLSEISLLPCRAGRVFDIFSLVPSRTRFFLRVTGFFFLLRMHRPPPPGPFLPPRSVPTPNRALSGFLRSPFFRFSG